MFCFFKYDVNKKRIIKSLLIRDCFEIVYFRYIEVFIVSFIGENFRGNVFFLSLFFMI